MIGAIIPKLLNELRLYPIAVMQIVNGERDLCLNPGERIVDDAEGAGWIESEIWRVSVSKMPAEEGDKNKLAEKVEEGHHSRRTNGAEWSCHLWFVCGKM